MILQPNVGRVATYTHISNQPSQPGANKRVLALQRYEANESKALMCFSLPLDIIEITATYQSSCVNEDGRLEKSVRASEDRCNVHTHPLLMDFRSEGEGTCRKIPSQLLTPPPLLHAALSLLTHSWRHKNKVGGGTDGRTISIHFAGRDARCPTDPELPSIRESFSFHTPS